MPIELFVGPKLFGKPFCETRHTNKLYKPALLGVSAIVEKRSGKDFTYIGWLYIYFYRRQVVSHSRNSMLSAYDMPTAYYDRFEDEFIRESTLQIKDDLTMVYINISRSIYVVLLYNLLKILKIFAMQESSYGSFNPFQIGHINSSDVPTNFPTATSQVFASRSVNHV